MSNDATPLLQTINLSPSTSVVSSKPHFWGLSFTPRMVLAHLTCINFFLFYDRGTIAGSMESIRADPKIAGPNQNAISETKGGLIVSLFMIGYLLSCPIFASMGTRFQPKYIMMCGLSVWLVACFLTGFAESYEMLLVTRMFVGIGEAAFAGYSVVMIDRVAPEGLRTLWIAVLFAMIPFGVASGVGLSGVLSDHAPRGWRFAFLLETALAAPFVLLLAAMPQRYDPRHETRTTSSLPSAPNATYSPQKDPIITTTTAHQREDGDGKTSSIPHQPCPGTSNDKVEPSTSLLVGKPPSTTPHPPVAYADIKTATLSLIHNLNFILVTFGYGMHVFVNGALAVWSVGALVQGPWQLSAVFASVFMGSTVGVTGLLGSLIGGWVVDKLGGGRREGPSGFLRAVLFMSAAICLCVPFGITAFFVSETFWVFAVLIALSCFFLFTSVAPIQVAILNSSDPTTRSYAISYSVFFAHLVGNLTSPLVTGAISDRFGQGCPEYRLDQTCRAALLNQSCVWVPPHKGANGFCANTYQLRNALSIVFLFLLFAIPGWLAVARRIRMLRSPDIAVSSE